MWKVKGGRITLTNFLSSHFHLIFVALFFALSGCLLSAPPIWDEWVYLQLASQVLSSPFNPFPSMLSWVPHPPLLWYLLAFFHSLPRLVPLLISAVCVGFLFYVCRRLYGDEVAKLSVAVLISTGSYMLYSLVMFPDGSVMVFMAISVLSFLCWIKLGEKKFLCLSGLGLALASLTDYTAVPILLMTFVVWAVFLGRSFDWPKVLKFYGVIAISLLPLAFWVYKLSQIYGNIAYHYSSVYSIFPSSLLPRLTFNIIYFGPYPVLLGGLPLISWVRKAPFDIDSKLLLIYSAIIFIFFLIITPLYANASPPYNRYLLPMVPALTVISARNLAKEKPSTRLLILCPQFLGASIFTFLVLLSIWK